MQFFNRPSHVFATAALLSALVIAPIAALAQDTSAQAAPAKPVGSNVDVQINNNGKVTVHGAKVGSISGSTIVASVVWGTTTLTWTINTNASTEFLRRYSGNSSLAEMSVGDYVNFNGTLDTTQSNLVVLASVVRDNSIQKVNATFSGSVQSIATSTNTFALLTKNRGTVNVKTAASTTIIKGGSTISFGTILVGDTLTASGVFDNNSLVLAANKVVVDVPKILEKHTFEGKLNSSVSSSTLPTSFTLTIGNTNYTVNVPANTAILTKNWATTNLGTFQLGDNVRVYGSVEAQNLTTIDAVVVRDASR